MRFGAHISSQGGVQHAPTRAAELGGTIFQMFSRPPQGGKPAPITADIQEAFSLAMKTAHMEGFYIHAPYFVNLASSESRIYHSSVAILREELERGSLLGATGMMFHPGSGKGSTRDEAQKRVIKGLQEILKGYKGSCRLLIENAAGAGEVMGDSFEELALFMKGAGHRDKVGICFDTQHAFASGYDLRTKQDVDAVLTQFDAIVGLSHLVVIHTNDSKVPFSARRDRHEHLGKGEIGKEGFLALVHHPLLQQMDFILETPKDEGRAADMHLLLSKTR